ncbi:MAG: hypothetical protein IH948_05290, partial [Bacteroidetes bacterium]|nr:hypothetical protein [Bacteroidota bacterium]
FVPGGSSYVNGDFILHTFDFSVYPEFILLEKKVTLVAGIGPYFGNILGSKVTGTMAETIEWPFSTDSIEGPINGSAKDYFLTKDVGLEIVTGAEFEVAKGFKILLETNLKLGLVNYSNGALTYGYLKPYNFYVQLGVGYHFKDKNIREILNSLFTPKNSIKHNVE